MKRFGSNVQKRIMFFLVLILLASCEQSQSIPIDNSKPPSGSPSSPTNPTEPVNPTDPTNPRPTNPSAPEPSDKALVQNVYINMEKQAPLALQNMSLSVNAALIASQLSASGSLVTTGTLTQNNPKNLITLQALSFSYAPEPKDKLRITMLDGKSYELNYVTMQGDFSSADAFLLGNHRLDLKFNSNDAAENQNMSLNSVRLQGHLNADMQGTYSDENAVTWTVDFNAQGPRSYDPNGPELSEQLSYTGSLSSETLGIVANIDKNYSFYSIASLIDSGDSINHSWMQNGDRYHLDMDFRRLFKDGRINEENLWRAQGELSRNAEIIGRVSSVSNQISIKIFLDISGERIDLYSFFY